MLARIGDRVGGAPRDIRGYRSGAADQRAGGVQFGLEQQAVLSVEAAAQLGDDGRDVASDDEGLPLGDAEDRCGH